MKSTEGKSHRAAHEKSIEQLEAEYWLPDAPDLAQDIHESMSDERVFALREVIDRHVNVWSITDLRLMGINASAA